jgi:hypothetical protein
MTGLISAKVVKVDAANDLALLKAEGWFAALPVAIHIWSEFHIREVENSNQRTASNIATMFAGGTSAMMLWTCWNT